MPPRDFERRTSVTPVCFFFGKRKTHHRALSGQCPNEFGYINALLSRKSTISRRFSDNSPMGAYIPLPSGNINSFSGCQVFAQRGHGRRGGVRGFLRVGFRRHVRPCFVVCGFAITLQVRY